MWVRENVAALTLRHDSERRCYVFELNIPSEEDLSSGTYTVAGGPGSLGARLVNPERFAAGEVARIREMGVGGIAQCAREVECS